MSEFSGKTLFYWGVLRPDEKAVMECPLSHYQSSWRVDKSLDLAGFADVETEPDSWEANCARRCAAHLTQHLVDLGVTAEAARHRAVLFTITTSVSAQEVEATA